MLTRIQGALRGSAFALLLTTVGSASAQEGDAKRGEYLAKAGGCVGCHTEEREGAVPFAGGRALKTPFGTFYGPNITSDRQAGIGGWTAADFSRAIREGKSPDGAHYYPAFPYPSFTKITDTDLRDLWAYLRTLPPASKPSPSHELHLPFRWRFPVLFWKWLFFTPGPYVNDPKLSPELNRGAYLIQALGHCGECHTPRNVLGGSKQSRFLAGGKGPDDKKVPNLTPTGLKKWGDEELRTFLATGLTPDGDVVAQTMGEVINNTTSQLTPADLAAVVAYLRSLPALPKESD